MYLQYHGPFSPLLFVKALTQTLLLQFLSPGRDIRHTCYKCPDSSWKNLTENWLHYAAAAGSRVRWDHGPNSSYRDLVGEQVQLSSDTEIVPLAPYLNSIYQHLTFYTQANIYWKWLNKTAEMILSIYVHSFQRLSSTGILGINVYSHRKLSQPSPTSYLCQFFQDSHWSPLPK